MKTKTIKSKTFVLGGEEKHWLPHFDVLCPEVLSSHIQVCEYISHASKQTLWISTGAHLTGSLLQCISPLKRSLGNALLLYMPTIESMPILTRYFHHTVYGSTENFLPLEELIEVLVDDQKADLVIGGIVDYESLTLTLWRGSFEPFPVPFSAFASSGSGVVPDFDRFRVIDYGQTIQLGQYEAATEALLYEFDLNYRRRISKERRESEQSFGAALRRLRKQRGLRREDFSPLSAKEVARIEQGKILPERIHGRTWELLTKKLGVEPEEIETF